MHSKKFKALLRRVSTGFPKLDQMLQGGLPENTITLLSGGCGTGKSTFAMQFLYAGAEFYDEPGVYVSLEETPDNLIKNMAFFGWDLQDLIDKKKLIIIKPDVYKFDSLKQIIADSIERINAKRLVVDSYSVLLTYFSDQNQIRNGLIQLDREIKKMDCTALVISDIRDDAQIFSTTGIEEFIVDGVIVLSLIKESKHPYISQRAISIRKMRATNHPLGLYSFDISAKGIEIGNGLHDSHNVPHQKFRMPKKIPKPRKAPKAPKAVHEITEAPKNTIEINDLRSKGTHSWKWKHL